MSRHTSDEGYAKYEISVRLNARIVMAAEKHGWDLVWEDWEPTGEEMDLGEPGSNSDYPIWGVHAVVGGERCFLWACHRSGNPFLLSYDVDILRGPVLSEWLAE